MPEAIVLVHGGAGEIPDWRVPLKMEGVRKAARNGMKELLKSRNLLDAAEVAVKVMEDDTAFNAGHGSVLTSAGTVEMDALIVNGSDLKAGAVACIKNVAYPISVARQIMEKTDHAMLAGDGATDFARKMGFDFVPDEKLATNYARLALQDFVAFRRKHVNELGSAAKETSHGTVGAVVFHNGHVVSATSTGGITGKLPGRVGDTPIIGAGGIADDSLGAVSATGWGEAIMRSVLSRRILDNIEKGMSAQEATEAALEFMYDKIGPEADGGAITLSSSGGIGVYFTSRRMAWAYATETELHYGIERGEHFAEPL